MPDHAAERSWVRLTVLACRILLNLSTLVCRVECASSSFAVAPAVSGLCSIRCNEFAGSLKTSLYCGRKIFSPTFFPMIGYCGPPLSSPISTLLDTLWGVGLDAEGKYPKADGGCILVPLPEGDFFEYLALVKLGRPNSSSSSIPQSKLLVLPSMSSSSSAT